MLFFAAGFNKMFNKHEAVDLPNAHVQHPPVH